jgi:hypothetical protein
MKRRLSSILVPIYKLIFIFVSAEAIYWLFQDFSNVTKSGFIFLLVFCGVWYLLTFRWKSVYLKGNSLLVSNYLKTIDIPFAGIETVEASSFWGRQPQTITLTLKTKSAFGNKIIYVPRGLGLHAKPFADELRQMIDSR